MTKSIPNYLGKPASILLNDLPFKNWQVEKSYEDDLELPIVHYVFPKNGLELRCDGDDRVSSIFLFSDKFGGFDENLLEAPFSSGRQQVAKRLGTPSKSSDGVRDPILGEYGAWDRFSRAGYAIHVEYDTKVDRIKQITLIRSDIVP